MNKNNKRWVDYTIFGLTLFLIFCLLFESHIQLPNLVAWLGHWHPLVLHFPIVLLIVAIFLGLTKKKVPHLLILAATLSALITAISGFMLGLESINKGSLLEWHQWLGSGVAILSVVWYWLITNKLEKTIVTKVLQITLLVLIGFAGHYGGMVTHGEDFLAFPKNNFNGEIPENPQIYAHIIQPILDAKCVSCHNPNKQKGELLLTDFANLIVGGETGASLDFEQPEKSDLLKRILLPLTNEDHMPPEGKQQLDQNEIQMLERWVLLGASDTLMLNQLANNEPLTGLVQGLMQPNPEENWEELPTLKNEDIQKISSDYITITRIAGNSNALSVTVYAPPTYTPETVLALKPLIKNIVQLDLSGLPIGDSEMDFVATGTNLEWLEVDKTPLTDEQLEKVASLSKIAVLKAYDTKLSNKSIGTLKKLTNLKSLYVGQTKISEPTLDAFQKSRPNLKVYAGINTNIQQYFEASKDTTAVKKDSVEVKK